jgi:hypothetical protein
VTATNHGLAGAVIGLSITQPAIALPLALISHFVLDALPHFDMKYYNDPTKRKHFIVYLAGDAILLATVISYLYLAGASWLVFACLFLAGSPDFVWAYRYIFQEKLGKLKPRKRNWFNEFHASIQWSATPKGILVEAPLAIIMIIAINSSL